MRRTIALNSAGRVIFILDGPVTISITPIDSDCFKLFCHFLQPRTVQAEILKDFPANKTSSFFINLPEGGGNLRKLPDHLWRTLLEVCP